MAQQKIMQEIGVTGLDEYHGYVTEQWVADLRTHAGRVKIWDEISRLDPVGSAVLALSTVFMRGAGIGVEPASTSKPDLDAAAFVESCLHDMSKSFEETMADIVQFLAYGFFDVELVYKKRDDGRIGWRKWGPRHPVTLERWNLDKHGGLQGMWQQMDAASVYIPIEKLLHFTTTGAGKNSPEGKSLFEGAFTSWFFSKNLSIQAAIIVERMTGTPVMEMPDGADMGTGSDSDLSRAKKVVRNIKIGDDMGLTLPHGWSFRYEMPTGTAPVDPIDLIVHHQRNMARTVIADFLMLGGGDQGSYAMHKDKSDLFIAALNTFLRQISSVLNRHAIPRLMELNAFPGITGLPKLYFVPLTKIDIGDYAEVIASLLNAGGITYDFETELAVRRRVGLPEIEKPGLLLKPNLPAQPPSDNIPAHGSSPDEEPAEDEELSEPMAFGEPWDYQKAVYFTDDIAKKLVTRYKALARHTISLLLSGSEAVQEEALDDALDELETIMIGILRGAMLRMWDSVAQEASVEGLMAIAAELGLQQDYILNSLSPAIRAAVLGVLAEVNESAMAEDAALLALSGCFGRFEYRVSQYAGSVYKLYANHARAAALSERMRGAGVETEIDWHSGLLSSPTEELLARYEGPEDQRTCASCQAVIQHGWYDSVNIPPIGSLECNGGCRHIVVYKAKGRIYR